MLRLFLIILTISILGFSNMLTANDVVKERKQLFRMSQQDIKSLYASIKSGDIHNIKNHALSLADWGSKMPAYFPKGSGGTTSDASEKIWEEFEEFKKAAKSFESAAISVVKAVETSDKNLIVSAASSVGNTCKSCHRKFKK